MSRVNLVREDHAPEEVKDIFQKIEGNGATVLNLYRVVAHSPHVVRDFIRLANSLVSKTALSPKMRELAIMRIAMLCRSEYEWLQHVPVALEAGVSREQLAAISSWKESDRFTADERAVLQYVEEVAENVEVREATFIMLKRYLSERDIVELTLAIGWWGMIARLLVPLAIEMDEQPIGSTVDLIGRRTIKG
jgi:alkylhydroperoxidase family enzyme